MERFKSFRGILDCGSTNESDVGFAKLAQLIKMVFGSNIPQTCAKNLTALKAVNLAFLCPSLEIESWDKMVKFFPKSGHIGILLARRAPLDYNLRLDRKSVV